MIELVYLDRCLKETLRLRPPIMTMMRMVKSPQVHNYVLCVVYIEIDAYIYNYSYQILLTKYNYVAIVYVIR